jgi:AcrR family transcriptional regulator
MTSEQNMAEMVERERPQRSDAARNRRRLLEAATAVFAERGLDAGVGEIAARAGVGRGTLFRNFASKEDLIAAIVVERMREAIGWGRDLLTDAGDDSAVVFEFMAGVVNRQRSNKALVEAVADEFLANPEIRAVHAELLAVLEEMLEQGKRAGAVRPEVGALDVMMLVKGVCATASALEASPEVLQRHLDLIGAAISSPGHTVPLRGRTPTVADLAPEFTSPAAAVELTPQVPAGA